MHPDELEFATKKIQYLGHIIPTQGKRPNPEKIKSMLEMKQATNIINEVQTFFGLT